MGTPKKRASRASSSKTSTDPKAADTATEDAPTDAPAAPEADANPNPDTDAKAPAEGAEGAEGAKPEPDPIVKLQTQRSEAEKSVQDLLAQIGIAAAEGKVEDVSTLNQELGLASAKVAALSKEIADTGFAKRLEECVRTFLGTIGQDDIPEGDVRLQVMLDERKLVGVTAVRAISSGKSGKSKKSKGTSARAALRSQTRDPRLPPAGMTLPSLGGEGRGACQVTYTETAEVIVSGPCADGSVLTKQPFTSVSKAGLRVTGSPVNGYVWAQLGSKGHSWVGHQVDRKNSPID